MCRGITFLFLLFTWVHFSRASLTFDAKDACDFWEPYRDQKCIKSFDVQSQNHPESEEFCRSHNANLITIDSSEKQKFMENFLKSRNITNDFWLGLKYLDDKKTYQRADRMTFYYANWNPLLGSPRNNSKYCALMKVEDSKNPDFGKWFEQLCSEHLVNLILCEKIQKWSPEQVQLKIMELTNQFHEQLQVKIMELTDQFVPIGSIYVQLPREAPPNKIWPSYKWTNISPEYDGVFFRVEGKHSSPFGTIQEQSNGGIKRVKMTLVDFNETFYENKKPDANNQWSRQLVTGPKPGTSKNNLAMKFLIDKSEVRPRNMALRIWRRTK